MDMWAFAASALIFSRSADAMRVLNLISFFMFFSNRSFKWVWASARNLGAGLCPLGAFGRAAALPQTRQMRCWPPPTEVIKAPVKGNLCAYWEQQASWRDLPSTAEKQDVSSAGFQGIFSPFTQLYSDIPVWWYHYPRRALHAVETLDARGSRRLIRRFYAAPEFAPCGQNIPAAGTTPPIP